MYKNKQILLCSKNKTRPEEIPRGGNHLYLFCRDLEPLRRKLIFGYSQLVRARDGLCSCNNVALNINAVVLGQPPEPVHVLSETRKPILGVAMIACVAQRVCLLVADDVIHGESVVVHQPLADLRRQRERLAEILLVRQSVLADLNLDIRGGIIIRPSLPCATAPAANIVRQQLCGSDLSRLVLADDNVGAALNCRIVEIVLVGILAANIGLVDVSL